MANLQKHAMHIPAWELSDLDAYVKCMEVLSQDLLRAGHTELIADDCIVANLLKSLTVVPSDAPHLEDWKFAARTWKADHAKNSNLTWL
eukprot:3239261-Rhodomonas_salina.1